MSRCRCNDAEAQKYLAPDIGQEEFRCFACTVAAFGAPEIEEPPTRPEASAITRELFNSVRSNEGPAVERYLSSETRDLLEKTEALLRRFVVLPEEGYLTLCLWVLHTWAFEAAGATPYVFLQSAEKRSGKTRVFEVLGLLVRRPITAGSISAAAIYQTLEADDTPSLMIDEVDAVFGGRTEWHESLRGVLNAGNRPGSPVIRGSADGTPLRFETFSPKALAGIDSGKFPDTLIDRSIVIRLRRKLRTERVERFKRRTLEPEARHLRKRFERWAPRAVPKLEAFQLTEPIEALSDRQEEAWEALFAIASLAGPDYSAEAVHAAQALAGAAQEHADSPDGHLVLEALRHVFEGHSKLASAEIVERLNGEPTWPFAGWNETGVTQGQLARLLRPYDIRPRTIQLGDSRPRGYHRSDFIDAWKRYCGPESTTPATSQQPRAISPEIEALHDLPCSTPENGQIADEHWDVADVAPEKPPEDSGATFEAPVEVEERSL